MAQKFLLDTHALIWYQDDFQKISDEVIEEIRNPENEVFFSQISFYEIAIKQKIGKLSSFKSTNEEIYLQAIKDKFTFLNILNQHIFNYQKIPLHKNHRDPFDRLLIATAFTEKLTVITIDENFSLYKKFISVLW